MKEEDFIIDSDDLEKYTFLVYCKNCFIDIFDYSRKNNLFEQKIKFKSTQDSNNFNKCNCNDNFNKEKWLIENGYKKELYKVLFYKFFFSLIFDFYEYYSVSLENIRKENIHVAWSLLRKPIQETLAYIEWLYVDKDELIKLMIESDSAEKYELKRENRKTIIESIYPNGEFLGINMNDFRYSYKLYETMNGIFQYTNHVITTKPKFKTAPSGLNCIFEDKEIVNNNKKFYFNSVPYVMLHTITIIFSIFYKLTNLNLYTFEINLKVLYIRYLYSLKFSFEEIKETLALNTINIYCPKCGAKYNSDKIWYNLINDHFICNKCNNKIDYFGFVFDFEDDNIEVKIK